MEPDRGAGHERACRLSNTTHSEILPSLHLPSLPMCFGAADQHLGLPEDAVSADSSGAVADPSLIAELLGNCDVHYLNLKEGSRRSAAAGAGGGRELGCSRLYPEVLKHNPEAFAGSHPAASKAVNKEMDRYDQLFYTYADKSSGLIDPEGIESFCSDVEVEHTDVRILILAWKMKAEKQGYFTLEEWRRGLKALRADSISKIKKALAELEKEVLRPTNFSDFYIYSFRYCLTEDKQKTIDIESACELLNLVLGLQYRPQVDELVEYLKNQHDYKVINMDQWSGFLRFCSEIHFPSLDNYDSELAWPLILDNFTEWLQGK